MSKPGHMPAMEHYSVIGKNEVSTHTTTCIDLKGIVLSETTQYQKVTHYVILIIQYPRNNTIIAMKIKSAIGGGQGMVGTNQWVCL